MPTPVSTSASTNTSIPSGWDRRNLAAQHLGDGAQAALLQNERGVHQRPDPDVMRLGHFPAVPGHDDEIERCVEGGEFDAFEAILVALEIPEKRAAAAHLQNPGQGIDASHDGAVMRRGERHEMIHAM